MFMRVIPNAPFRTTPRSTAARRGISFRAIDRSNSSEPGLYDRAANERDGSPLGHERRNRSPRQGDFATPDRVRQRERPIESGAHRLRRGLSARSRRADVPRAQRRRRQGGAAGDDRADGRGGVVLSGHTDVVPVEGQDWSGDPFALREIDGRLYGRGACDMKGFDAVVLAMVPVFQAAGLKRPIHIVLSYDEETTCLGSLDMIARFGRETPRPALAIVGEPTMMAGRRRAQGRGDVSHPGRRLRGPLGQARARAPTRWRSPADIVSEIGRLARAVRGAREARLRASIRLIRPCTSA